jgi:amidase
LAPSLDTIGPLARDVAGVVTGMGLLVPGWAVAVRPASVVGRLRIDGVNELVEGSVDAALRSSGLVIREMRLPGWDRTWGALDAIILGELWKAHHTLLGAEGLGSFVNDSLQAAREITTRQWDRAMSERGRWQLEVAAAFEEVDVLALPTLIAAPPPVTDFAGFPLTRLTAPFNLAGVPALSMPIPSPGFPVPVSLQLVGPVNGEDLLCATALALERTLNG